MLFFCRNFGILSYPECNGKSSESSVGRKWQPLLQSEIKLLDVWFLWRPRNTTSEYLDTVPNTELSQRTQPIKVYHNRLTARLGTSCIVDGQHWHRKRSPYIAIKKMVRVMEIWLTLLVTNTRKAHTFAYTMHTSCLYKSLGKLNRSTSLF